MNNQIQGTTAPLMPALAWVLAHIAIMGMGMWVMFNVFGVSYGEAKMTTITLPFLVVISIGATMLAKARFAWNELIFPPVSVTGLLWIIPIAIAILQVYYLFFNNAALSELDIGAALSILVATFFVAYAEELTFRGIALNAISKKMGVVLGVLLSSVLFSVLHSVNHFGNLPAEGVSGQMISTFIAGLFYALVYIQTRSLWPVIILHWNWDMSLMLTTLDSNVGTAIDETETVLAGFAPVIQIITIVILSALMAYKWRSNKGQVA